MVQNRQNDLYTFVAAISNRVYSGAIGNRGYGRKIVKMIWLTMNHAQNFIFPETCQPCKDWPNLNIGKLFLDVCSGKGAMRKFRKKVFRKCEESFGILCKNRLIPWLRRGSGSANGQA